MAFSIIQPSFAAGELSPSLYARVDLAKYHVGCALARNFFVDYRGGVSTRPGTEFIAGANPSASGAPIVIPFEVDTTASYCLEVGNEYIRFYYLGAPVVEATTAITGITRANPGVVTDAAHGYSNGDEVFITSVVGMTNLNGKTFIVAGVTTNTYTLKDIFGNVVNTTGFPAYVSGGTAARIYTLASPWGTADLPLLKYTQSADVMTLTHPNYYPQNLTRVNASQFAITPLVNGPTIGPPTTFTGAVVNSTAAQSEYPYQVTAVSADGKEESLPAFPVDLQGNNINDAHTNVSMVLSWAAPAAPISIYNIYKAAPSQVSSNNVNTVFGFLGQSVTTNYTDACQTTTSDFSRTPPLYQDPFSPGQLTNVSVLTGGSGYTGTRIALTFTGGGGSGAAGYGIVNAGTGKVTGVVITNYGKGYATVPTVSDAVGTATYAVTLGALTGTYPGCVTYFQQRRVFGATLNNPESMWFSQTGNYNNFDTSVVVQAADAISLSIASRQVNAIKSMVPMSTGLVIFTTGGGFLVSGGSQSAAITPSTVTALPQASSGANDLPPLVINYDILYCQARGAVVRDLAFDWYKQSYTGTDRSVLASHLFFDHTLVSWCYAEEPYRIVHVVRDDGVLLQFTYVPEQEVFAWTHHDTNGLFVSVTTIPEGQENAVYMVTQRYVQGAWRYYIERFASRVWNTVEDTWCVDAALAAPRNYPAAALTLAAATGNGVEVTASAGVFAMGNVGDTIWAGGGKATVATYVDSKHLTVNIIQPFPTVPNDPNDTPLPYAENAWSLDTPIITVSGLDHLDGLTVTGIADGVVVQPLVVANGSVTLPQAATKIVLGLGYQCQFQTLKLDTGDPTIQGKRKTIPAVTWRVNQTLGLKTGPDFSTLSEIKYPYTPVPFPPQLVSDDLRKLIQSVWKVDGQVVVQQDYPLPATLLGYIPEEVVGDTGR